MVPFVWKTVFETHHYKYLLFIMDLLSCVIFIYLELPFLIRMLIPDDYMYMIRITCIIKPPGLVNYHRARLSYVDPSRLSCYVIIIIIVINYIIINYILIIYICRLICSPLKLRFMRVFFKFYFLIYQIQNVLNMITKK